MRLNIFFVLCVLFVFEGTALASEGGKLLATSGLVQIEGGGGGGIVPWATLSGYDTREQWSGSAFLTNVRVDDFRLTSQGAALSFYDRVELSLAQQTFDLTSLGSEIRQNILGFKLRLFGDAVYGELPQFSFGVQHKTLLDKGVAQALGAEDSDYGIDFYLAATKVHLGMMAGFNLVWNASLRATKANQLGLLGFGGDKENAYSWLAEGSFGVLLSRSLAIGLEYRQKPDNLSAAKEEAWRDVFIAYLPNKNLSLTAAYAQLGKITDGIAGTGDQSGFYLSLAGSF